jgi:putative DNA primase/helicase
MLGLAESAEWLVVEPDDLDADPMLLNVENGTLDLRSAALREQRPSDLLTKLAPVAYDAEAECPTFDRFLVDVVPDEEVRTYLQSAIGYSLTGDTSEQCLFLPEGPGANGKSTLLEAVMGVLGDYARHADASTFTTQPRRGVRSDLARLQGARLVVATEIEDDARLAEVLVKQATGGEKIVASRLYRDEFEFRPEFKAFLAVNRLPEVRGDDHAIWRRIRRVPFPTKVERPDKRMPEKLRAERAGILAWMVRGCLRWQREGLYPPRAVREATEDYRGRARHADTVTRFVEERCRWAAEGTAAPKAMYDAYRTFCAEHGWRAVGAPRFKDELEALGAWRDDDDKRRLWRGIGLAEGAP